MRYALLSVLEAKIFGFHSIKAFYVEDEDFKKVVEDPSLFYSFTLQEGFLFKRLHPQEFSKELDCQGHE